MNILPLSYSCSIFLYIVSVSSTHQLKLQRACISMALYNKVVTVSAKFVVENTDTRGDEINSLYHTDILEDCKRFQEREKKNDLSLSDTANYLKDLRADLLQRWFLEDWGWGLWVFQSWDTSKQLLANNGSENKHDWTTWLIDELTHIYMPTGLHTIRHISSSTLLVLSLHQSWTPGEKNHLKPFFAFSSEIIAWQLIQQTSSHPLSPCVNHHLLTQSSGCPCSGC